MRAMARVAGLGRTLPKQDCESRGDLAGLSDGAFVNVRGGNRILRDTSERIIGKETQAAGTTRCQRASTAAQKDNRS